MNAAKACGFVILAAGSLLLAGCDPVRTTSQTVRLQVLDSASGQPVAGARVLMKFDYRRFDPAKPPPSPEDLRRDRANWRECPWASGTSDSTGLASVPFKFMDIDSTRGPTPPPWRDSITGKSYFVKVRHGDLPEETLSLLAKPGQSVEGKSYTVVAVSIDDPFYVDTSN